MLKTAVVISISWAAVVCAANAGDLGESFITRRLDDQAAVYVESGAFGAKGDGAADDAPAIQKAIDTLQETRGQGIVFLAQGRYRLGQTINLWKGIRLIGFGTKRPVLVLASRTSGFGGEVGSKYMVHFRDARRKDGKPVDARNTTFASGLVNVNVEIAPDSGAYAAVRYNVAQLCTLRDIDFRIADDVEAAIHSIGNEVFRCRFFGGRHGIVTGRTSAGWQSLLMDCSFEGQSTAAIRTELSGLTVLGCSFRDTPAGIVVPPGRIERLYVDASVFENIPVSAIHCDGRGQAANQINLTNVACRGVPRLLALRSGAREPETPGETYFVRSLSHGLLVESVKTNIQPRTGLLADIALRDDTSKELPDRLPDVASCEKWINVRQLGVKGDGKSDDTAALAKAVADHDVLYLPAGRYMLSEPLRLGPSTGLIGLHPRATQLVLKREFTSSADTTRLHGMVVTPPSGHNVVRGLALVPGDNSDAAALQWQSGPDSLVDDVYVPYGTGGGQLYGLWVTRGGGGTFKNIWAPNDRARSGLFVSNTKTPGRAILCSIEHHQDFEVVLDRVHNWTFHALQTEAEGNGYSTAVAMTACENITFTNLYLYRTSRTTKPHPHAIRVADSRNVVFRGVHNFSLSRFPYTSTLVNADTAAAIAAKETAYMTLIAK